MTEPGLYLVEDTYLVFVTGTAPYLTINKVLYKTTGNDVSCIIDGNIIKLCDYSFHKTLDTRDYKKLL